MKMKVGVYFDGGFQATQACVVVYPGECKHSLFTEKNSRWQQSFSKKKGEEPPEKKNSRHS